MHLKWHFRQKFDSIQTKIVELINLFKNQELIRLAIDFCAVVFEKHVCSKKVTPCKITPKNIQRIEIQVTLYQRSYRTFVKALLCRAKAMVLRYNYGMWSHFSIVHNASIITYSLNITPEQCPDAC